MLAQIALACAFNATEGFDLSPGAEFGAESGAFWGLQGHWFFASRGELAPTAPAFPPGPGSNPSVSAKQSFFKSSIFRT